MGELSIAYLSRAETSLLVSCLFYFLMNGAQVFETAVFVPTWTSRVPASLSVLQGPFAPDLKTFWIIIHSIHELTLIASLIFCWQIPSIRFPLLIIFALHFGIRIWTIGYFAPKIMAFQRASLDQAAEGLASSVLRWKNLNYLRVAGFVALSVWNILLFINVKRIEPTITKTKTQHMEQRLSVITLGVNNLPAQVDFFKKKIGWKAVAENKDIIFFKMNGFLFSLLDKKVLAEGAGINPEGSGFKSLTLSCNVSTKEQVDELYKQYQAKEVRILKPPSATPFGGYYFTFSDPEDNVFEVAFNPYIPLDESGNTITHKSIDHL